MRKPLLTLFLFLITNYFTLGQTILNETFDTDAGFTKSSSFFSDGASDYFGIAGTSPDFDAGGGSSNPTGLPSYTNLTDNYLVGEGASLQNPYQLTWSKTITGYSNITFFGDFAQGTADKIDAADYILVEYSVDGGSYQNLMAFEGADFTGVTSNGNFREDTDFDGTGDGTTLTSVAQTFSKNIAVAGTTLNLRLTVRVNANDEEFGIDNFKLLGTYVGFDQAISSENETNAAFAVDIPVTLSNYDGSQVDLSVAVTGGTADVSDYTLNTTSLSFTGNATQNISITLNADADDLDETIEVTLSETSSTNTAISPSIHTLTILDDDAAQLLITEIHYNPNPDDDATHEFLEIYNVGSSTVNLNGYQLSNGISHTFGASDQIAANEYIIVARDATTYQGNGYQVFDISSILNNTGETVALESSSGRILDEVTYNASDISATSNGFSYELININEDNSTTATNWQASAVAGGTPGVANGLTVWQGSLSTDWATAGNWSNGVPTSSLNAYIDDGANNNPVLAGTINTSNLFIENGRSLSLGTGVTVNIAIDLKIETGGNFSITDGSLNVSGDVFNENTLNISGGTTTITGNFDNESSGTVNFSNGTVKVGRDFNEGGILNMTGGTLEFNGTTSDNQKITGSNTYHNITINNTGGGYIWFLNNNHIINNTLTLTSGNLDIQTNELTIASGGNIAGGSSSSYIKTSSTGKLKMEVGSSDVLFPIGNSTYNPITLNNAGTIDNFLVSVLDEITENGASGGTAITTNAVNRMWMVEEETVTGSNVTMTFQWNTSEELTNFDRTNCFVSHYTGGSWTAQGAATNATGSNPYTISATGITTFSPFAVGDNQSVLPVELTSFDAITQNNAIKLTWQTASELNNHGFEIEKSINGVDFENIGFVEGKGTTTTPSNYTFKDDTPFNGINYYRLKQIDLLTRQAGLNGQYEYSNVVAIAFKATERKVELYPIPTKNELNLAFENFNNEKISLKIYNEKGQLVRSEVLDLDNTVEKIDVSKLANGVYFIKVVALTGTNRETLVKRFIKI